jgi:hypothetical protein
MMIKVGYTLMGTIELEIPDEHDEGEIKAWAERNILECSATDLIDGIEGMPNDIEGDAIEVISVEKSE